jgi:hypothetical protein
LIVGPSGAGKSSVARQLFGEPVSFTWGSRSVVDEFPAGMSMTDITGACSAVGFNTIPSWMKPYSVLSTGERFRVDLARTLAACDNDILMVDEFTSVVDRQVAQIGSHAVQKFVRKNGKKFVAVTCHNDIEDWLQPDWVLEPATMTFRWRLPQRRPVVEVEVARVDYSAWKLFAPFHYMTADLHRAAKCYIGFVNGEPVNFHAVMHRVNTAGGRVNIMGGSRTVTLPDWQGLGLSYHVALVIAGAYKAAGYRYHVYPAHPVLLRSYDRSPLWAMVKKPGTVDNHRRDRAGGQSKISRPNAVFAYCGPTNEQAAKDLNVARH